MLRLIKVLAVAFLFTSLEVAYGQTITLTSPSEDVAVKEGDDFANNQLGNRWDMSQTRDVGWEDGFTPSTIKSSSGIWSANCEQGGGNLYPLFGAFKGVLFAEGMPGDKTLPRFGVNHPVNTARYRVLSYKLNASYRSSYALYWNNDTSTTNWATPDNMVALYDGFFHASNAYHYSGWKMYSLDLSNLPALSTVYKGAWTNKTYALRFDPVISAPAGTKVEIDWMRLVDPDSAPSLTVSWNAQNIPTKGLVTIYYDTDGSGYDGIPIAEVAATAGDGSYTFSTAILPPGAYRFYVELKENRTLNVVARSEYSAQLSISNTPTAYITSPTTTTGKDYATETFGDPWDMANADDLINLDPSWPQILRQFSQATFSNGKFRALADEHLPQNSETDAQLHFRVSQTKPIDTRYYRYITYRIWLDGTNYPSISNKIGNGFITRPVFWNQDISVDGVRPPAHLTYEGWHTYTYDMKGSNAGAGLLEAGVPYSSSTSWSHFRIDPMETSQPTWFSFDWVKLNAENEPTDEKFNISWVIEDKDSSAFNVKIYYDKDNKGYNGTLITSLDNVPAGAGSYQWNTLGRSAGNYFIYLVISDGENEHKVYSPVHIAIGKSLSFARAKYDYDGDRKSDRVVYRRAGSSSFLIKGSKGTTYSENWGTWGDSPIEGDFDGDKKSDLAIIRTESDGQYNWIIRYSSNGQTINKKFGSSGDTPVVGDYNGDGKSDIAVFRNGLWSILYADGSTEAKSWGKAGDIPLPADYTGDGKTDTAVWRLSTLKWYIRFSNTMQNATTRTRTFGKKGDKFLPGDFTKDGRADLAVYRKSEGTWYVQDILSYQNTFSVKWGGTYDTPVVADFNGDKKADFALVTNKTRNWKHYFSTDKTATAQFGAAGDILFK